MAAKAGHTGNLDPFATGLLPICLGEATKFSHYLLDADKTYRAVLKLGVTTSTGDTEGEIITRTAVKVTFDEVVAAVHAFQGPISQIPPMHSALKYQGKPLYEYARAGVEVERKPRDVMIYDLALERLQGDEAEIFVRCSKGTYIRVLAEDIGAKLGCGAHLTMLRRLETGGFKLQNAYEIEALERMDAAEKDQCLLPVDVLLKNFPAVEFDAESAHYFRQGQAVWHSGVVAGMVRAYGPQKTFIGLAESIGDGLIAPRRVVHSEP